jgi:hypothetical protein
MKNVAYLLIALFMVSCGSNGKQSKYGQTIGTYLQTDKRGSKYDLKFKVIELNEQGTITVADSIAYLTDEFRKDNELIVRRVELAKKMTETLLAKEKKQREIDKYNSDIARMVARIDSLRNLPPDNLNGYDSKNPNDVLALIIRCKYSIVPPGGTTVEETFDFYLSPDGSYCYGKTRAK